MSAPTVAVDLVVTGRVQGVSFRAATRAEASRLDLAGWVRNEPDGSVAVHAEGPPDAVESLVAWCRTGPPSARVADVRRRDVAPQGGSGFDLRW